MSCWRAHKGRPAGSRDPPTIRMWSDGSRRASETASVYARARRPVPHSESVRTRFHISHNRLAAERGTVERSFLAAPISPRPFWYPMWSLISPVCSGHILVARHERSSWYFGTTRRYAPLSEEGTVLLESVRFIEHIKAGFLWGESWPEKNLESIPYYVLSCLLSIKFILRLF